MMLFILLAIYASVIAALIWLLSKLPRVVRHSVWLSFVLFGVVTGIMSVWLWPLDSCILPNVLGVSLGDWLYVQAIAWMGNPHSERAHESIPWLFRIPQVYGIASVGWCGLAGWLLHWLSKTRRHVNQPMA